MRKKVGIIKRVFTLLLIFLLSINSFAAVVSDNDGSAFITKAEFDALKSSFQSQIDTYNQSIDSKIDGAIASYLSGITLSSQTTFNIINNTWGKVTALNGVIDPTFKLPTYTATYMWATSSLYDSRASDFIDPFASGNKIFDFEEAPGVAQRPFGYAELLEGRATSYYNQKSSDYQLRPLVSVSGSESAPGDLIWNGVALNYKETFDFIRTILAQRHWSFLDDPEATDTKVTLNNFTAFDFLGYLPDLKSGCSDKWPVQFNYTTVVKGTQRGPFVVEFDVADTSDVKVTSIELGAVSGKTSEFLHVINYNDNKKWSVSNETFTKTFRPHTLNTNKASTLLAQATNNLKATLTANNNTGAATKKFTMGKIDIGLGTAEGNDYVLPSIGMLAEDKKPSEIYQDNVENVITVQGVDFQKNRPNLKQGMQLLCAKRDTIIEWMPTFNYTYAKDASGAYTEYGHEVDVYLSYEPFGDGVTTTKPVLLEKDGDATYATTKNKVVRMKWTMDRDSMVYVKWVPHFTGTSYINDDWKVTLDVASSNQYVSEVQN